METTLYYWPEIQGRGEFVRLALEQAAVPYTDLRREDEAAIRAGAARLREGRSTDLPPRHLVSAAHYALEAGRVQPTDLAHRVTRELIALGREKTEEALARWEPRALPVR
jgi:hypothetical protein